MTTLPVLGNIGETRVECYVAIFAERNKIWGFFSPFEQTHKMERVPRRKEFRLGKSFTWKIIQRGKEFNAEKNSARKRIPHGK